MACPSVSNKRALNTVSDDNHSNPNPAKKRKLSSNGGANVQDLMMKTIAHSNTHFLQDFKSDELSAIITEYMAMANTAADANYAFVYVCSINQWRQKHKLKKHEKLIYIAEQLVHPLQYLAQQFELQTVSHSVHYQYFIHAKSTSKIEWSKNHKFWVSRHVRDSPRPSFWSRTQPFLSRTIDAVCHFVQNGSGTGVHVGDGYILSCAHVIACDQDDEDEDGDDDEDANDGNTIDRIGRQKYVIFSNGNIYRTTCIACHEAHDLSLSVVDFESLICIHANAPTEIGTAVISETEPNIGDALFCVGNPSNINLESGVEENNDFEPKIFHLSFGALETKTEAASSDLGGYGHSCWTYWGHSGAPLFNAKGEIVGLHNSWNDQTGLRHAVTLNRVQTFLSCKKQ